MIDPQHRAAKQPGMMEDMEEARNKAWQFMDDELDKPLHRDAEATCYKSCLSFCGGIQRNIQCVCATCGCGPLKTIEQGNVGLKMRFGKFVSKLKPGLHSFNPCTEEITVVDTRAQVMDVGHQSLLTKDNVTVYIDAYVNYRIVTPEAAIFKVNDYKMMMRYFTQGVMKTIVAEHTLTDILINRKTIESKIAEIMDDKTDPYGIKVFDIETQKIELPNNMERAMATVAETEKQSEARLVDAKGNLESAKIFKEAADELSKNEMSLQLQYFETLKFIAAEKNRTIILPDSLLSALRNGVIGKKK